MDSATINLREVTYDVITSDGHHYVVRGRLQIMGDFVIIGKNTVFHRPSSVVPQ